MTNVEKMSIIRQRLGKPKRYIYRAHPVIINYFNGVTFEKKKMYGVDFERACDLREIEQLNERRLVTNAHVINVNERGCDFLGENVYVSHTVIIDEDTYEKLLRFTNTDGKLKQYIGVVRGYLSEDVQSVLNNDDYVNTGLCLLDDSIDVGVLDKPDIAFDIKSHRRYIQACDSYINKLNRLKKNDEPVSIMRSERFKQLEQAFSLYS
ncbi:hypothetical protein J6A31_07545 [bacterium]|nr:hypothetical protein [bacterium]